MQVHLIDGTYELFRQHFGQVAKPRRRRPVRRRGRGGRQHAAAGAATAPRTSAVASDHVIESFRNDLWPGYKTSAGMDPVLLVPDPGDGGRSWWPCGFTTWAMVEYEADDALGAAAAVADADPRVEQVLIVTPDKDLGQCVRGTRVVQYDRRKDEIVDEAGGDRQVRRAARRRSPTTSRSSATPPTASRGSPGWGAKSAAAVLAKFGTIEAIPASSGRVGPARSARRGEARRARCRTDFGRRPAVQGRSPPSRSTSPSAPWTTGSGGDRRLAFAADGGPRRTAAGRPGRAPGQEPRLTLGSASRGTKFTREGATPPS